MSSKRHLLPEFITWIHTLLLFAGLYPLFALFCGLHGEAFRLFCTASLLLAVPIVSSRLLLGKIRHLMAYLFSGILISGLVSYPAFLLGNFFADCGVPCCVLTAVLSCLIFCIHTYAKITYGNLKRNFQEVHGETAAFLLREWDVTTIISHPSPLHWIWFTALYIAGILIQDSAYLHMIFYMVLADIFLCFFYHYINEFHEYIRDNSSLANLPVETMKRVHRITGTAAVFLLILFTLPALLYGEEPLESIHPQAHVEIEIPSGNDSMMAMPEMGSMDLEKATEGSPSFEPPEWLRKLADIILYGVSVLVAFGVLAAIYHGIKNAGKSFAVENEDEIVFLNSETDDEKTRIRKSGKSNEGWLSPNAQIRRRYKRTIRKSTKGKPKAWATPTELEQEAQLPSTEGMQALHHCYEKARYSKDGCTRDDLVRLR